MPTSHFAAAAQLAEPPAAPDASEVRAGLVARLPYVLVSGTDDPQDLLTLDAVTGAHVEAVVWNGKLFVRDAADTTTAHDGIACLVSASGDRYKPEGVPLLPIAVTARQDAPPGSPALGDAYIVGAAPSGAWAAAAHKVAVYTARGWEFITPRAGLALYSGASDSYWRYTAGGTWVQGFGSSALGLANVVPGQLLLPPRFIVENQTTNTPPGTVVSGQAYIIGPSPTGAWVGHSGKLAVGESGAWVVYAPATGWLAFDKATGTELRYLTGTGWVSAAGAWVAFVSVQTPGTGSQTGPSGSSFWDGANTSPSSAAPTTSHRRRIDDATLSKSAPTGKRLRFRYQASFSISLSSPSTPSGGHLCVALYRDSETTAIAFLPILVRADSSPAASACSVEFVVSAPDALAHTYRIALVSSGSSASSYVDCGTLQLRSFTCEEGA